MRDVMPPSKEEEEEEELRCIVHEQDKTKGNKKRDLMEGERERERCLIYRDRKQHQQHSGVAFKKKR